ncbi:MAG: hypothetical protein F4Z39_15230, partial [Chloroflexi bacterium]|nr:hypothetical protein [Chloroflexota bacterium]
MTQANFTNRTVWVGDNLHIMRGINSACIDLIYLDPPFNSNQDYAAPIGSIAAGAAFKDTWTLSDIDVHEHGELADRNPAAYTVIEATRHTHGKSMMSYLIMMAVRLIEMERILKPTGSIYLHCDDTAAHYLKLLMDAVFGAKNYRNNIVWRRATSHNDPGRYGRICDHIFYYVKSDEATWNGGKARQARSAESLEKAYPSQDERGRYRSGDLTGANVSDGESGMPWKGYDVSAMGRHWSAPRTGTYAAYIEEHFIPGYRSIEGVHERLEALDAAGLIHHPKRGRWPGLKRYADADAGTPPQNLILNPIGFTNYSASSKEYTGFKTQKRVALLEHFIKISSNPGDTVFDPFCGCATTMVAADRLERVWAGIDISPLTIKLVNARIREDRGALWGGANVVDSLPKRTDLGVLPNYRTHRHRLYGEQEGVCVGCDSHFPFRVMEVDHILPKSRGGTDHLENLQLLCSYCNRSKGNKTMAEWRAS